MKNQSISIGETAKILGVSVVTIRRWDKAGKLCPSFRTFGNHRRYSLNDILKLAGKDMSEEWLTVCYARVSSHDQKKDLVTQGDRLLQYCKDEGIFDAMLIKDLGYAVCGLNYKKPGLNKLIKMIMSGKVKHLVLTYKDRLLRFGSELIFKICEYLKIKVTIINKPKTLNIEEQLSTDVIELMTVFSARLYGLRSSKIKRSRKPSVV